MQKFNNFCQKNQNFRSRLRSAVMYYFSNKNYPPPQAVQLAIKFFLHCCHRIATLQVKVKFKNSKLAPSPARKSWVRPCVYSPQKSGKLDFWFFGFAERNSGIIRRVTRSQDFLTGRSSFFHLMCVYVVAKMY